MTALNLNGTSREKYILELAILTVWADRKVEETEKEYIKNLLT
jgi:hypothetical protein